MFVRCFGTALADDEADVEGGTGIPSPIPSPILAGGPEREEVVGWETETD